MNFKQMCELNCLSEGDLKYISDFCLAGFAMGYKQNDIVQMLAHKMEKVGGLTGHIYRKNLKYIIREIASKRYNYAMKMRSDLKKMDKLEEGKE